MHYHFLEDKNGDVIDNVAYCSDFCHCEGEGDNYNGWNGCHEGSNYDEECANCGEILPGLEAE